MKRYYFCFIVIGFAFGGILAMPQAPQQTFAPKVQPSVAYALRQTKSEDGKVTYSYEPVYSERYVGTPPGLTTTQGFQAIHEAYGSWPVQFSYTEGISPENKLILVRWLEIPDSPTKFDESTQLPIEPRKFKIEKQISLTDLSSPEIELYNREGKKLTIDEAKNMVKNAKLVAITYGSKPSLIALNALHESTLIVHRKVEVPQAVIAQ